MRHHIGKSEIAKKKCASRVQSGRFVTFVLVWSNRAELRIADKDARRGGHNIRCPDQ